MLSKFLALILLLSASIGCEKTITEQVQPATGSSVRVAQLLENALLPGTSETYAAITATYKSLNYEELEVFNTLRMESEDKRMRQRLTKAGARVSQEQLALVTQALRQVRSFRSDVNKRSLELYGVPYNQVADSLVSKLLDQVSRNYIIEIPNLEAISDPRARPEEVMGCTIADFPYVSTKFDNGNLFWNYWGEKKDEGKNDCDYEFRYSGYNYSFDPKDWFADRLCDSFNNRLQRRSNSTYTRLLLGKWRVIFWEGYPGATSIDMYD